MSLAPAPMEGAAQWGGWHGPQNKQGGKVYKREMQGVTGGGGEVGTHLWGCSSPFCGSRFFRW